MNDKKVRYDPQETVTANEQTYSILDLAQRTATLINVGQKTYTEKPAPRSALQVYASGASPCPPVIPAGATCKDDGPETLNGRNVEKWEMSQSVRGAGQQNEQTVISRIWVDAKLHVWIKVESTAGTTLVLSNELQDVQEGPQPASLFAIPPGFRASAF
jgi:hypothetical protein